MLEISYSAARRTHETGVRMALGPTPAGLRVGLLRQGPLPIAAAGIRAATRPLARLDIVEILRAE